MRGLLTLQVAASLSLTVDFDFPPAPDAAADAAADTTAEPRDDKDDSHSDPSSDSASVATPPARDDALHPVDASPLSYVLTLLSPTPITPHFLSRLAAALSEHALTAASVTNLSSTALRSLELLVEAKHTLTPRDVAAVRTALFALGRTAAVEVALQVE